MTKEKRDRPTKGVHRLNIDANKLVSILHDGRSWDFVDNKRAIQKGDILVYAVKDEKGHPVRDSRQFKFKAAHVEAVSRSAARRKRKHNDKGGIHQVVSLKYICESTPKEAVDEARRALIDALEELSPMRTAKERSEALDAISELVTDTSGTTVKIEAPDSDDTGGFVTTKKKNNKS